MVFTTFAIELAVILRAIVHMDGEKTSTYIMKILSSLTDRKDIKAGVLAALKSAWGKVWLAMTQFLDKGIIQYAGALAFNTVLAIVPLVALFFAIARGFGYGSIIEETIRRLLTSQPEAANYIIQFADSYLSNARSSAIIGFGVLVMLYSVVSLINNVETVFNNIWNVKRTRQFTQRVMNYLSMFFLVPITIVIVSGIHLAVSSFITNEGLFTFMTPLLQLLIKFIPILVITIVFTLVFVNVPNTRVQVKHAIIPALLTAIFMELLQRAYVYGQIFLSSYNAIYGSLAALPLFMLWVQFSWYIILFFALLSHTSQNHDFYALYNDGNDLSHNDRMMLSATLLGLICRRFGEGKEHYTSTMLNRETGIPTRLVAAILDDLCAVKILVEREQSDADEPTYVPFEDIANITVGKMVEKLNSHGKSWGYTQINEKINPKVKEHIKRIGNIFMSGMKEVKISELWSEEKQ